MSQDEPVDIISDSGELLRVATRREAFEEVGISGDFKLERVGSAVFNRTVIGRHENHLFVMFKIYSDATPVLNEESDSCQWFTTDELRTELAEHPEHFGGAFHFCVKSFFPDLNTK